MNNFFLKRVGILEVLKEIYLLEKLIFKDEVWTLKIIENELSNGNNFFTGFLKNLSKIPSVFLEVKKSNFPAINPYKKHDFKELGIRNNYYKDGSSAMLMHYYQNL